MPAVLPFPYFRRTSAVITPRVLPFPFVRRAAPPVAITPRVFPFPFIRRSAPPAVATPRVFPFPYFRRSPPPAIITPRVLPFPYVRRSLVPAAPVITPRVLPWPFVRRGVILPSDILAAIKLWFAADTELVSAIPGGLWVTQAPGNQVLPYAVVALISESSDWASGSDQVDQDDLQFSIYGATALEARTAAKLLRKSLDNAALAFADGYLMGLYHKQGLLTKDPNRGPRGFLWHQMFMTTAFVGRHS
jgi:hypothetical protein